MALPLHALQMIAPYLSGKVLSLGYPDLEVTGDDIQRLFGFRPEKYSTTAHKWHGSKEPFPDTEEVFGRLEVNLTVVDFTKDRGMEKIADLNHPQDLGQFDLVIDPGTLEHCFNIGQAFLNVASAVNVGGVVFHLNPMNMLNHGFYNINPTLMHDFYVQNGWQVVSLSVVPNKPARPDPVKRFTMIQEHLVRTLAKRLNDDHIKFPVQTKYLKKMEMK